MPYAGGTQGLCERSREGGGKRMSAIFFSHVPIAPPGRPWTLGAGPDDRSAATVPPGQDGPHLAWFSLI